MRLFSLLRHSFKWSRFFETPLAVKPGWVLLSLLSLLSFALRGYGQAAGPAKTAEPPAATGPNQQGFVPSIYRTFASWKTACDRLPSNRSLKLTMPPKELLPLKNFGMFMEVLDAFFRLCKTNTLAQDDVWLGGPPQKPAFFNTDAAYFLKPALPFQPFVQRQLVPAGSKVFFHGDLHGDLRSLVAWIDWLNRNEYLHDFTVTRPDVYIVLLGDYTDRGSYSVEVLYTLLRLKVANPEHVMLVRGNHEDVNLASRYGFIAEAREKYGRDFDLKHVMRLYDFLPVVLYLGCESNVIQCNHGGIEPGFDPRGLLDAPDPVRYQLLGRLNQSEFLHSNPGFMQGFSPRGRQLIEGSSFDYQPETPTSPTVIGFMWNDFSVVRGEPEFDFDPGRAFIYGEKPTQYLMEHYAGKKRRIQAIFRAHQQATVLNGMMRRLKAGHGVYRHWQDTDSAPFLQADLATVAQKIDLGEERQVPVGSVWTFNVTPDSVYGEALDYSFDTFGLLTTAPAMENWRLRVINQTIPK